MTLKAYIKASRDWLIDEINYSKNRWACFQAFFNCPCFFTRGNGPNSVITRQTSRALS